MVKCEICGREYWGKGDIYDTIFPPEGWDSCLEVPEEYLRRPEDIEDCVLACGDCVADPDWEKWVEVAN